MRHPKKPALLALLLVLALGPAAAASARGPALAPAPGQEQAQEQAQEPEAEAPLPAPEDVGAGLEVGIPELEQAVEGRSLDELRAALAAWMALVEREDDAQREAAGAEPGTEQHKAAAKHGTDRDALIARAEVLIAALDDAGGPVDEARAAVAEIRDAGTRELATTSTVPADQGRAQDLPLEVLRASLRPLTKDQVAEQLEGWLALLQKKCLEVRTVEVAALESKDPAEVSKYNERAVQARGERGRLIQRVEVVVDALDDKNGDVEDARAYLESVVVAPPISGWRAAWTTARAWLFSPDGGLDLGLRLLRALAVVVAFWILSRLAARLVRSAVRSMKKTSELLREFAVGSTRKAVFFLGLVLGANQLGFNMGPLLAVIGAAGLVIGLALQGTLSNFASGLLIMIYRPFDVGDVINAGGIMGKVEGMTLVTTLIRTFDNQSIYVPNNNVWGDVITNVTANETRRVDMTFGIGYDDDVERAREVLLDVVRGHEKVLEDPEPMVQVAALADSSVNFIVRPWARTEDYWAVYWDLTREVKKRFDREDITIPYPQRDVHVHHHADESPRDLLPPASPAREEAAREPSERRS